ncbi:hypothetical protein Tsubulata_005499 [Turnera subulata]|uniref:Uncharacterized protein n=1 Tax=Turnera subulata TaxID=218843 RepID=A0A9Q0FIW6_9ROSI|nr:hypothetical protein Tsubulata_005499 [Turnera subulata]
MNFALLQTCLKNKLSRPNQLLQSLTNIIRHFSSFKFSRTTQTKRLHRALRILDLVAPKTKTRIPAERQNHFRLIQDFLQTDRKQDIEHRYFTSNFVSSDPFEVFPTLFDEILEPSSPVVPEQDCGATWLRFDVSVLSNAVSGCASTRDLRGGIQYHCLAVSVGFLANAYIGSSLITLYGKCGELQNAYKVFHEMPVKNVVSWTAIISVYAQEWKVDVCLELYSLMRRNSILAPNDFTFTSLLSACTGSGALGQGKSAHCQIIKMGFDSYLHISNALMSMYCKCGNIPDALSVYRNMGRKDIVSWNSMIAGYAQHGLAVEAIELFEKMKKQGVKPDAFTFLGVLSSCRHAGLVEEGKNYFNSMVEYGVTPELDHCSCIVDLLGRAGLVEEARDFVERMPVSPNAIIWGSLLSSCRLHGNVWIGIQAAESKLLLEPGCAAAHVQLANLYSSVGYWDQAARVRKSMKDRSLKINPGCSWIEIKNLVHRFSAEDSCSDRMTEIVTVLDCLVDHMIAMTFEPEFFEEDANDYFS